MNYVKCYRPSRNLDALIQQWLSNDVLRLRGGDRADYIYAQDGGPYRVVPTCSSYLDWHDTQRVKLALNQSALQYSLVPAISMMGILDSRIEYHFDNSDWVGCEWSYEQRRGEFYAASSNLALCVLVLIISNISPDDSMPMVTKETLLNIDPWRLLDFRIYTWAHILRGNNENPHMGVVS